LVRSTALDRVLKVGQEMDGSSLRQREVRISLIHPST